jgi:hypothetical protein
MKFWWIQYFSFIGALMNGRRYGLDVWKRQGAADFSYFADELTREEIRHHQWSYVMKRFANAEIANLSL